MSCSVLNANILNVICLSRISFVFLKLLQRNLKVNVLILYCSIFKELSLSSQRTAYLLYHIFMTLSSTFLIFFKKVFDLKFVKPLYKKGEPVFRRLWIFCPLEECLYIITYLKTNVKRFLKNFLKNFICWYIVYAGDFNTVSCTQKNRRADLHCPSIIIYRY